MMNRHSKASFHYLFSVFLLILLVFTIASCESSGDESTLFAEYILNPDGKSYTLNRYQGEDVDVVIPKTYKGLPVTIIGRSAFLGNHIIETVVVSNNVIKIEAYAFREVENLREFTFEENSQLVTMEDGVFEWSDQLKNITLPKSVIDLDDFTFELAYGLENIHVEEGNPAYSSQDGILFNQDFSEIIKYPDGKLGTTYEVPATVTRIGNGSFNLQHNLETITFHPNSQVTSIGKRAFMASSIQSIVVPKTVQTIEDSAFSAMHNILSISFEPNSQLKTLGNLVFEANLITTITLPASLMEIENDTFSMASNLLEILVDENSQHFRSDNGILFSKSGDRLFHVPEAMPLTNYVIPKEVIHIEGYAFSRVATLTNLTFEEGTQIQTIGEVAFSGIGVQTFTLPRTVIEVGDYAFSSMLNLKTFIFEDNSSLAVISNDMFRFNMALESITIPKSVTAIGDRSFWGTKNLEWVLFEENSLLQSIGEHAFTNNSSLETFVIPEGVTTIGNSPFLNSNHVILYAESESASSGWGDMWNSGERPIYWAGEWSYVNGFPKIIAP